MNVLNLTQGTPEWHEVRAQRFTASEAPAMMGASKYQSRDDLLKQKATGIIPEVSEAQQRLFDKGHKAEADARPMAEEIIGEELFPGTIEDDAQRLLASMDGLNMMGEVGFEHKLLSARLVAAIECGELEDHYKWQMDQQMLVSGADSILFMCSDGTKENCHWLWYERDESRIQQLLAGWEQFEKDLAAYAPTETKVEATGKAPDELPVLRVELTGAVAATNLPEFKERALAVIDSINTELTTDQHFADADKAVKFLEKGEKQLEACKVRALEQTASIDELFKTIDSLKESMRDKRLKLAKLVKTEKENRRTKILTEAKAAIDAHIGELEKSLEAAANCPVRHPGVYADVAGAMKGKKTISSLESAANDTVATAKIEANQVADGMRTNIAYLNDHKDFGFLFSDYQTLLTKAADDFQAVVKSRIAEHKDAEEKRLEAQREQIRKEEEAKAQAKANEEAKQPEAAPEAAKQDAPAVSSPAVSRRPTVHVSERPSNDQLFNLVINAVVAKHNVTPAVALDWLAGIDFNEKQVSGL